MKTSGIYHIVNLVNFRFYIGSAQFFPIRERNHFNLLRSGRHHSIALQRAWNKYGESSFEFRVVEFVDDKLQLIEVEQRHIDAALRDCRGRIYNTCLVAGSVLGLIHSSESKAKMAAAKIGKTQTLEHRAKISAMHKGKKKSAEHIAAWVKSRREGLGWSKSAEHLAKLSAARKGKSHNHGAAISASLKGRTPSEAHKLALRESNRSLSKEQVDDILARRKSGETYVSIAKDYDTTKDTVRNWCLRFGEARVNIYTTAEKEAEMISRWRAGESKAAIAEALGVSETTVWRKCKKWETENPPTETPTLF